MKTPGSRCSPPQAASLVRRPSERLFGSNPGKCWDRGGSAAKEEPFHLHGDKQPLLPLFDTAAAPPPPLIALATQTFISAPYLLRPLLQHI